MLTIEMFLLTLIVSFAVSSFIIFDSYLAILYLATYCKYV